ncbi:MAG: hypothetical protein U0518_01260 [Candidatus Gracilibacteria bacterium]
MQLLDFHTSGLSELRKRIGADLLDYKAIPWEPRQASIVPVNPSSIQINSLDNTITNNDNERIVVYIRDIIPYEGKHKDTKIHFYECDTIRTFMEKGKQRFVGAYTQTGKLEVCYMGTDEQVEKQLGVCSNCLKEARENKYIPFELLNPFSLKKYFDFYEYYRNRVKNPKYNFLTITKNQYPANWEEISKHERQKVDWVCQDCGKDYKNNKGELHVHHKDHNKGNNFSDNFEVLCYDCHAKHHKHM